MNYVLLGSAFMLGYAFGILTTYILVGFKKPAQLLGRVATAKPRHKNRVIAMSEEREAEIEENRAHDRR